MPLAHNDTTHYNLGFPSDEELCLTGLGQEPAQVRAEIDRVSFRNDENGWTVVRARSCDDDSAFTATGHFPLVHVGEKFELFGTWQRHPQYGRQFKIERLVPVRPTDAAAIQRYLASGLIKGIGPKTAAAIVARFGAETLTILDENPRRLLEVPKVGAKKAEAIVDSWQDQRAIADVMLFLNAHGLTPLYAGRIFRAYGADAVKIIAANPYRLAADIQGIGFLSADRIAHRVGIAPDSPERLRAAVLHTLYQGEEKGHCYITTPQLLKLLVELLKLPEATITPGLPRVLAALNETGNLITEIVPALGRVHFRADLLIAETNVAQVIRNLLREPPPAERSRVDDWLLRYAAAAATDLTDEQLEAVRKAALNRVFVLTGGPGVGKTTTANAIIRLLKAMGHSVAVAAPTGRAAQRLSEVSAMPAKTIHRLLEWQPRAGGGGGFMRDEGNRLSAGAIIIDEASMLDIRLADALLRAVDPKAQVIFIGDVDQLPSVGPGNVLRDCIDSGLVPYTRLSRIFRQAAASSIVRSAHDLNAGELPAFADTGDCRFYDEEEPTAIRARIRDLITRDLPMQWGFDPIRDVQVLTPMNRGDLGTQALNLDLQAALNPPSDALHEWKRGDLVLRVGDKVIQIVNNYELGVFNGDIGFVRATKVQGGHIVVAFGDRLVNYRDEDALDLRLAYAITIHKSQGSEFPAVIIPSSMQHYVMLQRNLMYTGLTRAKKMMLFVGNRKALVQAATNASGSVRQTGLVHRLKAAE